MHTLSNVRIVFSCHLYCRRNLSTYNNKTYLFAGKSHVNFSRVPRIVESGLHFFEILEDVQHISSEYVSTPKLVPNFSELRLVRGYLSVFLRISYALSAGGMTGIWRTWRRGVEVGVLLPTATPPATVLIALKPYGTALGTMGGCTGRKCV